MIKRFLSLFTGESYWKERMISALALTMYVAGNIIEYCFTDTKDHDPPAIWVTAIILCILVIIVSTTKWKRYTPDFFKAVVVIINAHIIYVYGTKTAAKAEEQAFYLMFSYAVFIVTSQMVDNRKQLILYTLLEVGFYVGIVLLFINYHPMLLDPLQQLMLSLVLIGNFLVGTQRLRLTQVTGGSSLQFKSLSENARDIQSVITPDLNFIYLNPAVQDISGFTFAELQGKNFLTIVADLDKESVSAVIDQLKQQTEGRQSVEYRINLKDGSMLWVESIFSLFRPDPNSPNQLVFTETRDIEARKMLEAEIQQQMKVEEMLIKHSNQFINVERAEIQQNIDMALGEFGRMLKAEGVLVYRMHGKLQDEFRSTNQWFLHPEEQLNSKFNLVVKINQQLLVFMRSMRGAQASHGNFIPTPQLHQIQIIPSEIFDGKMFYLIPLQSGNIVNGFVIFVFDENVNQVQRSFFGLVGNMIASAFSRLRTEMKLHELQLTNEFILRALPDWLYIVNKYTEFTGSNNYSSLEPYIPDYDLMGRKFRDVLPAETAELFANALEFVIENDMPTGFEFYDTTIKKGKYFKVIFAPFKANEYLIIIRDITDLKEAQNEIASKARKLELSNKELEEFAYVVSHDLKQPTKTIVSYLQLLKKKHAPALTEEAMEFVNYSIEGANKMTVLIGDILNYARMEQDLVINPDVDFNNMVTKVCGVLKDHLDKNNATVTIENELPKVSCNEVMISEIFQNLIENGIKYNISENKTAHISAIEHPTEWEFIIKDNGIGFDQKDAADIFKIFKRLPTEQEFQGTGIGLGICKKVIDKHDGKIWAISEKGKGSTFHFTLPKKPVS